MKLLLDTHALLWAIIAPEQLSAEARAAITDPAAQVAVSAVSFWEIAIKAGLGKLTLSGTTPEALVEAAQQQGFTFRTLPKPCAQQAEIEAVMLFVRQDEAAAPLFAFDAPAALAIVTLQLAHLRWILRVHGNFCA